MMTMAAAMGGLFSDATNSPHTRPLQSSPPTANFHAAATTTATSTHSSVPAASPSAAAAPTTTSTTNATDPLLPTTARYMTAAPPPTSNSQATAAVATPAAATAAAVDAPGSTATGGLWQHERSGRDEERDQAGFPMLQPSDSNAASATINPVSCLWGPSYASPCRPPSRPDRFIPMRSSDSHLLMAQFHMSHAATSASPPGSDSSSASAKSSISPPNNEEYKKLLLENLLPASSASFSSPPNISGSGSSSTGSYFNLAARTSSGGMAHGISSSINSSGGCTRGSQGSSPHSKILSFQWRPPPVDLGLDHPASPALVPPIASSRLPHRDRHISLTSERILDAPELVDDYYLNLLDWSASNQLAVALGSTVYLWNAANGDISQLMHTRLPDDYVTSLAWAHDGRHIAIGLNSCDVQIWDAQQMRQIRRLQGHTARVGSSAWNGHTLTTGGRDSLILNHDVRVREHVVSRLSLHEQDVCGVKWSPSGRYLASGGNDNMLLIWDAAVASSASALASSPATTRRSNPSSSSSSRLCVHRLAAHSAAVKALAWCPWQRHVLASGGGTVDRCIKFWNTQTGACQGSIDTLSQVCALQWNRHEKELLSSHGYSLNQLCLWKYPSMHKMAEFRGHTARVLHLAQSPDGFTVVSAAADETLRFWNAFGDPSESTRRGRKRQTLQDGDPNPMSISTPTLSRIQSIR